MTDQKDALAARIAAIKQEFLGRLKSHEVPNLQALRDRFRADPTDPSVRTDIRRVTHDLIGSGSVFGYDEISAVGRRLEAVMRGLLRQEIAEGPEPHAEIQALLDRLAVICAETERDLLPQSGAGPT